MKRRVWSCDVCHSPEQHDKPLHALYDDGLLLCPSCFNREIEHKRGAQEIHLNK